MDCVQIGFIGDALDEAQECYEKGDVAVGRMDEVHQFRSWQQ
jgi:hypothetical protein